MKLEEYIYKRKIEDGINEFDFEKRLENMQKCVNYIFEYFNNYLTTSEADEKTVLHEQKLDKYRNTLNAYDPEVREWLVEAYSSYGRYMNRQLLDLIDDKYFLLYHTDSDFRALSYEVYPKAVKKFKFLSNQSEMVYLFIKDAHRVKNKFRDYEKEITISQDINEWIIDTYNKYGVNIYRFCLEWDSMLLENPGLWPKGHKKKGDYDSKFGRHVPEILMWEYDYKQKSNLFCIDSIYRANSHRPFIKGKKQHLEIVLMYCWLHEIVSADNEYWDKYIRMVESKMSD